MAWPFSTVDAPNVDTGTGQDVPLVSTAIAAGAAWLVGAHFTNTDGSSSRQVTITDGAGEIVIQLDIPPGAEAPYEWPFRPMTGVKWLADGANVKGHVWGYE